MEKVSRLVVVLAIIAGAVLTACAQPAAPAKTENTAPRSEKAPATSKESPAAKEAPAPTKEAAAPTKQAAVPAKEAPKAPPKAPTDKVIVGAMLGMADAPIAVAMGKGFFKEQGIEIEIQRFKSGTDMIAPLAAGQVDVGTGGISPGFVNAVERGLKLRAVASKAAGSNGRGHNVLVGRTDLVKNGQLKGFEDLKGKKVGINALWSTAQYVLAKLQKQKGIIYDKDYELVILNTSDMTTALANKAIDVASIFEPISTRMEDLGVGVKWKRLDEIVPELQIAVVLYGGNFAEGRPEVGKRFMVAYLQGVRYLTDAYYKENKGAKWQEVKQMLVKVIPEVDKPELYDKVYLPDYSPNGKMFEQNMMDQMEWFKANGKIKDVIPLNQLVNYSFVDYALKQLGEYK